MHLEPSRARLAKVVNRKWKEIYYFNVDVQEFEIIKRNSLYLVDLYQCPYHGENGTSENEKQRSRFRDYQLKTQRLWA